MYEYIYENLQYRPKFKKINYLKKKSSILTKNWKDISYHNDEKWLKFWFEESLNHTEKDELDNIVSSSTDNSNLFDIQEGDVYLQVITESSKKEKRWNRVIFKIKFDKPLISTPSLSISNTVYDGLTNLRLLMINKNGFNISLNTVKGKNRNNIATVSFHWEAYIQ